MPSQIARTVNLNIAIRLIVVLAVVMVCLIAQAFWIKDLANEKARTKQLANAREHYGVVLAELDRRWGREAFNLKSRIESQNLLDGTRQHTEQLLAFLISHGTSIEFPSLRIEKASGEVIVAYDYASRVNPKIKFPAGQESVWVQDISDGKLYLVIRQFIWLGKENGYLLLFKPMDNALLTQMTYPGTRLSLWWKGKPVASSSGDDGVRYIQQHFPNPEAVNNGVSLMWSAPDSENAPKLLIEVLSEEVIGNFGITKPVVLAFMVIALAIGGIFHAIRQNAVYQLDSLLQAEERFKTLGVYDDAIASALTAAKAGPLNGLRRLAEEAEFRMKRQPSSTNRA